MATHLAGIYFRAGVGSASFTQQPVLALPEFILGQRALILESLQGGNLFCQASLTGTRPDGPGWSDSLSLIAVRQAERVASVPAVNRELQRAEGQAAPRK